MTVSPEQDEISRLRAELAKAVQDAVERETVLHRYQAELEAANAQLRELATTDPLTGLANRRAFDEWLTAEFSQAQRYERPLSVMMLDVDNFKQRNDVYGHQEGDTTLLQLAELLRRTVRLSDLVVRYGGEEFVLLLPETNEAQALLLGQRIMAMVRGRAWRGTSVTVSGGVAAIEPGVADQRQLVSRADEAMYAAKRAGKDRVLGYGSLGKA